MGLFGKLVKTALNVAEIPLAVAKDVVTLGGVATGKDETYTRELVEKIKEDADD
jgi:hypothetical protein